MVRRLFSFASACLAFGLLDPSASLGQRLVEIQDPAVCAGCDVALELVQTLSDDPDLEFPIVGTTATVVRDGSNRVLLVHYDDPIRIQTFDEEGRFVESVGSPGQGPGEFTYVSALAFDPAATYFYAFDLFQQRVTTFSSALEHLGSSPLPGLRVQRVVLHDEGFVVAARSYDDNLIGQPLHLLTREFELIRSFGASDETVRPDMPTLQLRSIAESTEGRVWSAPYHRYVLEEWDAETGHLERSFQRGTEWFEPWLVERGASAALPPQSRLMGIRQDEAGLLWALIAVAAEDWRSGLDMRNPAEVRLRDYARLYDTMIEVIDPATGELVLSKRVSQSLAGFTNDGLLIGNRHDDESTPAVDLWRATLSR